MGYKETVLNYVSAHDRRMSRRNMITGGLVATAVAVAGGDAALTLRRQRKLRRELEKIRPHVSDNEVNNAREIVGKYKHCQEITEGKCNEVMKPQKLGEVHKAEALVEEHDIYIQQVNELLTPEENRLKFDLLGGMVIPTIIIAGRGIFDAYNYIRFSKRNPMI